MIKTLLRRLGLGHKSHDHLLKTYSGKYKKGKAIYTYKKRDSGGRIYEGKFYYSGINNHGINKGKAKGSFKNDLKEGVWTYMHNRSITLKITYRNGKPEGAYELVSSSHSHPESLSFCIKHKKFSGLITGKHISFTWKRKDTNQIYHTQVNFTGQFDENGLCDGKWIFCDTIHPFKFYRIYQQGICLQSYCEDLTTGDYKDGDTQIQKTICDIIDDNFQRLEQLIDRNSHCWEFYPMELTEGGVS